MQMALLHRHGRPGQRLRRRRNAGTIKAAVVLVIVVVIVVILVMPTTQDFLRKTLITPFQESYPEYADITFQKTYTVNANGGNVENFTINSMSPQNISQEGVNLQLIESIQM